MVHKAGFWLFSCQYLSLSTSYVQWLYWGTARSLSLSHLPHSFDHCPYFGLHQTLDKGQILLADRKYHWGTFRVYFLYDFSLPLYEPWCIPVQ